MKRRIVAVSSALFALILIVIVVVSVIQRRLFFQDTTIIAAIEITDLHEKSAVLSEKMGIELDPTIAQHKSLIENYERIVIHEESISQGVLGKTPPSTYQKGEIPIYVDALETKHAKINLVLIRGLFDNKEGYTIIWQQRWKQNPMYISQLSHAISAVSSMTWDSGEKHNNILLCYYDKPGCWVSKALEYGGDLRVEYFPTFVTPLDTNCFGTNQLIQIWGNLMYTEEYLEEAVLTRIWFSSATKSTKTQKYEYFLEWWDKTIIPTDY